MKFRIIAIMAVALALSLNAAAANKSTLVVRDKVSLNGTAIAPGEYKVEWDDSGNVKVMQKKQVVATAQGKVTAQPTGARRTTMTTNAGNITELQFENSKSKISFDAGAKAD